MSNQMDQTGLGLAGIWGTVHVLRLMINRGLVSPNEVDTVFQGMIDGLQLSNVRLASEIEFALEEVFAEMRGWAKDLWIGGLNDPENVGE